MPDRTNEPRDLYRWPHGGTPIHPEFGPEFCLHKDEPFLGTLHELLQLDFVARFDPALQTPHPQ